ncbi:MAG TPA: aldo/keto reductase [Kofleriaceae bacterium]|nr:aldo/keto reductase [Kofleriaceae bacterium]
MEVMTARPFGRTGLQVSPLGLGAGQIGDEALAEAACERLIRDAVELGITLFDTARSYGRSEERLGRYLAPVRDRVVISTKIGYGIDGVADWTGECIRRGVERALAVLATDRIDIVHLHSCPIEILARGEVIAALLDARQAGKLRCAAYSGDNDALAWALACGQFDALQMSWSVCDQHAAPIVAGAAAAGLGVIAKRPLANAPWRFAARPVGDECEPYWERLQALALGPILAPVMDASGLGWDAIAARFAAHTPGVSAAITGTRSAAHLRDNAARVAAGPLPPAIVDAIRDRYAAVGAAWPGRI